MLLFRRRQTSLATEVAKSFSRLSWSTPPPTKFLVSSSQHKDLLHFSLSPLKYSTSGDKTPHKNKHRDSLVVRVGGVHFSSDCGGGCDWRCKLHKSAS